jgi:hypothetical protein
MIRMVMKNKNVDSLETLLQEALNAGVHLVACQMSMDIMGITAAELIEGVELAGVASYLDAAESSDVHLFIYLRYRRAKKEPAFGQVLFDNLRVKTYSSFSISSSASMSSGALP